MSWLFSVLIASTFFGSGPSVGFQARPPVPVATPEAAVVVTGDETERFDKTFPLSAEGRVEVSNINGSISIETWDRNEVRVEYVITADSKERLNDVEVKIDSEADALVIDTDYKQKLWTRGSKLNVDYRLTVPKRAQLNKIETINGSIAIVNTANVTRAKTVNGQVKATNLSGSVQLSAVNGTIVAELDQVGPQDRIALETVNGQANLTVPSDINATIKADTMNGSISNDFGLPVRKGRFVGRDLFGKVGSGESSIRLNSVNGMLSVKRRSDGKSPNPVTDLLPTRSEDDPGSVARADAEIVKANEEAVRELANAEKEFEKARVEMERVRPEIDKAVADAMREANEAMKNVRLDVDGAALAKARVEMAKASRAMRDRMRTARFSGNPPVIETKSDSFETKENPTVVIEAGAADVSVRGWDKNTVQYSVTRVSELRAPKPLEIRANKDGNRVNLKYTDECGDCPEFETRFEIMVPKRSNLEIKTAGELRLENVTGNIEIDSEDEAVNIRDVEGNLAISNHDGRVRVIGFRGDAEAATLDGDISLEGELRSFNGRAEDGTIIVTVPAAFGATLQSNTKSIRAEGLSFKLVGEEDDAFKYRLGDGSATFSFTANDGSLVIRSTESIRSLN